MKNVTQYYDDYSVFTDEEIESIEEKIIGKRIKKIHAEHNREGGSYIAMIMEDDTVLKINPTQGDFNTYIDAIVLNLKEYKEDE